MGSGASSYARPRNSAGTNSCRGTCAIAANTLSSVTRRRRICSSTIARRAPPKSAGNTATPDFSPAFAPPTSSSSLNLNLSRGSRMFLPSSRRQNLFHLLERKLALFFAIVKMRRKTHACLRPIIDQNLPRQQFAAHLVGMRTIDRNRPGSFHGILRRIHSPSAQFRALHQPSSHAHRFRPNGLDSNRVQDIQPWLARVQRRNVRRAIEIAERILARSDSAGLEVKGPLVRNPPRQRRTQLCPQIFANIQMADAGPAAKPLQHPAHRKI